MEDWKQSNDSACAFRPLVTTGYTRVDVLVEDVYTGSVESVDNVPMLVGVPASIITTATVSISKLFQTAFSTSGAYAAEVTTDGFVNPLKLLLSVRRAASYSPHLTANWAQFVRYCVVGASTPQQVMNHPEGVMGAHQAPENLQPHIHTRYYMQDFPEPTMVSCEAAGPIIAADLMNYFSSVNPALNRALRDGAGRSNTATAKTWEDVTAFYANNASLVGVDAQHTSANIMFYQMTSDVFKCGNQSADPNAYFSCTQLLSDQQQAFAVDAAAGASGMTRTMISSMGFLLALFIGLSPLVLLVALASASNALPLLGKYLMFGAWTQSWLPAAFLINFFIIETWSKATKDMVRHFGNSIPLEAIPLFWMETADKIAVASDLLAAVPLITLAAMTGSYFALAKLGERWSGKGYSQERMVTPELSKVGAVSSNASIREHSEGKGGQTVGTARPQINFSGALANSVADRNTEMYQTAKQVMDKWSVGGAFERGWSRVTKTAASDGSESSKAFSRAAAFIDTMEKKLAEDTTLSAEDRQELSSTLRAAAGFRFMGNGAAVEAALSGSGLRSSAKKWLTGQSEGQHWQNAIREEFSERNYSGFQKSEELLVQHGFGRKETKELSESASRLSSTSNAHEEAVQLSQTVGLSLNTEPGQFHTMVAKNTGAYSVIEMQHADLYRSSTPEGKRYQEAFDRISRTEQDNGVMEYAAKYGWMAVAAQTSGNHAMLTPVVYQLMGAGSPNSMVIGQNAGVGERVQTPHVVEGAGATWNVRPGAGDAVNLPAPPPDKPEPDSNKEGGNGSQPGAVQPGGTPSTRATQPASDADGAFLPAPTAGAQANPVKPKPREPLSAPKGAELPPQRLNPNQEEQVPQLIDSAGKQPIFDTMNKLWKAMTFQD